MPTMGKKWNLVSWRTACENMKNKTERKVKVLHLGDPCLEYRSVYETLDNRSEVFLGLLSDFASLGDGIILGNLGTLLTYQACRRASIQDHSHT
jgi:hypothetical protein